MFGMIDEITEVSQGAPDQRRYRRLRIAEPVSCLPVVELDVNALPLRAVDVSEGGVQVDGLEQTLATDSHALVYFAGAALPRLAQVVWSSAQPDGTNRAGLRFVTEADLRLPEKTPVPLGGKPKAVVVVRHPVVRDIAERVLKATRYETQIVGDEGSVDLEKLDDVNLLVIGESALRAGFGRTLQESRSRLSPALRIVLLNETATRRDVLDTVWRHHVEHMVAKDSNQEEALFTTLSKLLLGSYFGIRKYLLWGASTRSWQISDPSDKPTLFDEIRVLAASVHCHPRIADLLVAALDEMLINALYLETETQRRRPVTVEYGSDGRLLAVAVIYPYGAFEPHALYSALGKSLEQEEEGLPLDAEHGNLGFRTMFMALSHLVVNVDPGRRTEMIGLVDLRKSLREYRRTAPSLGVFAADKRT
jgi:hypothetical protein